MAINTFVEVLAAILGSNDTVKNKSEGSWEEGGEFNLISVHVFYFEMKKNEGGVEVEV